MFASNPSDANLNIAAQEIIKSDGTGLSVPPISSVVNSFVATTINFQTGVVTGGSVTITFPAATVGLFYRVGFTMIAGGSVQALFSTGASTLAAVPNPGSLFISGGVALGWVDLVATGTSAFKTAGSATNIIENSVGGVSTIHLFGSGSGGSGSGSGNGIGDDLDSLQFQASFNELFSEGTVSTNSAVDATTAKTNAVYSPAKSMWTMSYDAAKTIAAGSTTTNILLSAAPSYTVAPGDVVIYGGATRKVTAVTSQTNLTTEAFASAPTTGGQVTLSQAVHTKDIYNAAIDGVALSSEFGSTTFSEIMVDYKDNAISGSNIYTPNLTPLVGFAASPDATNWTANQTRPSSASTQISSVILPSAGTSLYLRWFSNAQSGSGTVNLISYRAFMQKVLTAAGTANTLWSTFGMTNGSTTPLNCSISVVGGKTTIQVTNNTYPVGALPGATVGALEVLLNGISLDRFVSDSTPATDAYYTEVDGRTIALDRDYSSQPLSISLIYTVQLLDGSSQNSTNIASQQEIMSNGFQSFVSQAQVLNATTTAGSPVAGTFWSSIPTRSAMPDLSQDLKSHMAIERIMVQQLQKLQNEFGPNGEQVFASATDLFNQIRFVGNWTAPTSNASGPLILAGATGTDFFEVTFYGTGLNVVIYTDSAARPYTVSVDGATATSSSTPAGTNILISRQQSLNQIIPLATGLTAGIHTVKFVSTGTTTNSVIYGFEILNSTAVVTTPGVAYVGGKKLALNALSSIAYNAAVTGTRGGRVLQYLSSAGVVAQAFTPVNSAAATGASADHTNEDPYRVFYVREFGAGRSDDFSYLTTTRSAFYTLDDGTTTLTASNISAQTLNNVEGFAYSATGQTFQLTFVGTGCDIQSTASSNINLVITASIDGGTGFTVPNIPVGGVGTSKIVSGLPYGTHTVLLTLTTATAGQYSLISFAIYQPKKPTLPSGAMELADYCVMAPFIANTVPGSAGVAQGILRKAAVREIIPYNGTFTTDASVATGTACAIAGLRLLTATGGAIYKYTFFGTGFDFRYSHPSTVCTYTVAVDGTTNLTSLGATTGGYGTGFTSFNAGTGLITTAATSGAYGNGAYLNGLALGFHTVTITLTSGSVMVMEALDIITPVYSAKSEVGDQQNTLMIGSNALSDNRKLTVLKDNSAQPKAWSMAYGVVSQPSTTSTSPVPCPDMSATVKTNAGLIMISYSITLYTPSAGAYGEFYVYVDGQLAGPAGLNGLIAEGTGSNTYSVVSQTILWPVSAGVHKVDLYWFSGTGASVLCWTNARSLMVKEQ
jgi:hypothetical protein